MVFCYPAAEAERLVKGVNVLVVTPGRLLDHLQVRRPVWWSTAVVGCPGRFGTEQCSGRRCAPLPLQSRACQCDKSPDVRVDLSREWQRALGCRWTSIGNDETIVFVAEGDLRTYSPFFPMYAVRTRALLGGGVVGRLQNDPQPSHPIPSHPIADACLPRTRPHDTNRIPRGSCSATCRCWSLTRPTASWSKGSRKRCTRSSSFCPRRGRPCCSVLRRPRRSVCYYV